MMPSRGLYALRRLAPRMARSQSRNFSLHSSPRQPSSLLASSRTRPSRSVLSACIASRSVRNASTNSSGITTPAPSFPAVDTLSLDDIDFSTAAISATEKIGYLKEIGLDYGWGPTAMLEWTIEHFHIWGGLPWWAAIAATAVTFRIITFPLFVKSANSSARSTAIQPLTQPVTEEMKDCQARGDTLGQQLAMQKLFAIRKDAGVRIRDTIIPGIAQGVIGFCGFKLLRAMSALPVPGLFDGGALWFTDLTIPDGYVALPLIMAVSMHFMVRLGGETGNTNAMTPQMRNVMLWGMPVIIFVATGTQSAALCVWFAASGLLSFAQALLLQSPTVRRSLGIAQIYQPPGFKRGSSPAMDTLNNLSENVWKKSPSAGSKEPEQRIVYHAPTAYTRPTYQAPSNRTQSSSPPVVDTTLVKDSQSQGRRRTRR